MRTLVFSDSHLGLSKVFDEKKFRFLEGIIKQADQVIINGDFWEGYLLSFKQFKDSPYKHLFPLLKARHTVYIPGNHDFEGIAEDDTSIFSDVKTLHYEMKHGRYNFVFEHGDRQLPISKFKKYIPNKIRPKMKNNILWTCNQIEYLAIRKIRKVQALKPMLKKLNGKIKKTILPTLKPDEIFICGHTHLAEFNLNERFINTGMVKWGLGQYLMIEDEKLTPHEEWYS